MNETDEQEFPEGPSKSQRKRDSTALQELGEALEALPADRLARVEMPDALRDAILEARRIRQFGALRRQRQYIGKLMRSVDPAPIRAQLAVFEGQSHAHTAWLHHIENLRERLLADEKALAQLIADHPTLDPQHWHTMIRNARRERAEHKAPRAYREIFQALKELIPEPKQDLAAAGGPDETQEDDHE